jgi:DNA-binding NarL/FixJ family response regulator
MAQHSVLLVEDDEITRARLAKIIEAHPDLELQAAVGSCEGAREQLERRQPAVLLTDLGLPDGSGIELIALVRERGLATLSMVITVFGDERHVVGAIQAGALGYLLKDGYADYIVGAILDMVAGGSPISPPIARYLLHNFRAPDTAHAPAHSIRDVPQLSRREQEVLRLVVKGFSYSEIGGMLGVSTHTVATHARNLYKKLAVRSRGEAVYEALQLGLVAVDD